jgi:septal ring-binding cell division protein DamX
MEDFVRELNTQAGLYLIYGDEGVGKTRLLTELVGSRLAERNVRWMDLKAGNSGDGVLIDSSVLIEKTFASASPGDVIIADHFETALKKTRHQLFLSWSTDGLDKKLNLIIAASSDYFNELRQLAQQYQVHAQSFQQVPFSPDEAAAFLGFYLFPDRPVDELVIPALLRNQLAMAQGNVGRIIEIAERAGDQISAPIDDSEPTRRGNRSVVGVVVAAALLLVVGWFYLGGEESGPVLPPQPVAQVQPASAAASAETEPKSMPLASAASETREPVETVADAVAEEVVESAAMQANDSVSSQSDAAIPEVALAVSAGADAGVDSAMASEAPAEAVDESRAADDPLAQAAEKPAGTPVVANDSGSNAEVVVTATEAVSAASDPPEQVTWGSARLRQDLQASLDWIAARERQTGTLQIMLLSQSRFDERVYYEHLQQLASQGVDLSRIRIFESYTGNKAALSVVYGEYPSRAAASDAKPDLPAALRKSEPVARSVGGLLAEIQRLREQN